MPRNAPQHPSEKGATKGTIPLQGVSQPIYLIHLGITLSDVFKIVDGLKPRYRSKTNWPLTTDHHALTAHPLTDYLVSFYFDIWAAFEWTLGYLSVLCYPYGGEGCTTRECPTSNLRFPFGDDAHAVPYLVFCHNGSTYECLGCRCSVCPVLVGCFHSLGGFTSI